jgi:hexosaminidase
MRKISYFIIILCLHLQAYSQNAPANNIINAGGLTPMPPPEIAIIPEPVSLIKNEGHFSLPANVTIFASAAPDVKLVVDMLQEKITMATGSFVSAVPTATGTPTIRLLINEKANTQLGKEGYQLSVTPTLIVIKANKAAGLFYGAQSLIQLFPKEIESKEMIKDIKWLVPCVEVTDYPKLGWRGLMFDVARHFFTKDEVKLYIDDMVRYKFNVLHLHLTDDEGWRIEIKGLPKLTEVGAFSVKKVGTFGDFIPPGPDEPRNYGGF